MLDVVTLRYYNVVIGSAHDAEKSEKIMAMFNITNKVSGVDLGNYAGGTANDALDAMAREAGYRDIEHAEAEVGGSADLIVTELGA